MTLENYILLYNMIIINDKFYKRRDEGNVIVYDLLIFTKRKKVKLLSRVYF